MGFPSQVVTITADDIAAALVKDMETLNDVALTITTEKPTRAVKDQIRRDLAGVIAHLEIIRLALEK